MDSLHSQFMLLPTFYGSDHLKISQIQNALLGQFISFPLVKKEMLTDF